MDHCHSASGQTRAVTDFRSHRMDYCDSASGQRLELSQTSSLVENGPLSCSLMELNVETPSGGWVSGVLDKNFHM